MQIVKITKGAAGTATPPSSSANGDLTVHFNTDIEGMAIVGLDDGGATVDASTLSPEHLNSVRVVGAAVEFGRGPGKVHAAIPLSELKEGLKLTSVDDTSDAAKPVSVAQKLALDAKLNIADLPTRQPQSYIDGLADSLALKLDKATYDAGLATQALGIKYEWPDAAAQTAQTGMVQGEQGVLVGASGAERDVYKYDGSVWAYSYKLSASHNHDDLYYSKSAIDSKLTAKLSAADLPTSKPVAFIDGLQSALDAKAPAASVKTPVPANVVFTTLTQEQQDLHAKNLTDNWAETAGSGAIATKSLRQSLTEITAAVTESSAAVKRMQATPTMGFIHSTAQRQNLDGLMQIIWDSAMDSFCLTTPALKTASGAVPKLDMLIQSSMSYTNGTAGDLKFRNSTHWVETTGNSITGAHGFSIIKPAFSSNYMEDSDSLDQFSITISVQSRNTDDVQMIYKLEGCTFINAAAGSKRHAHYTCTSFGVNNLVAA